MNDETLAPYVGGHPDMPLHPFEDSGTGTCLGCERHEVATGAARPALTAADLKTIKHSDPKKEHRLHAVLGCSYCDIEWLNSDPDPTGQGMYGRPAPAPPIAEQVDEFLGWLFRDGGLEPPRREYDAVEQRLRLLVNAPAPTVDAAEGDPDEQAH